MLVFNNVTTGPDWLSGAPGEFPVGPAFSPGTGLKTQLKYIINAVPRCPALAAPSFYLFLRPTVVYHEAHYRVQSGY